jgi:hypothetical protein
MRIGNDRQDAYPTSNSQEIVGQELSWQFCWISGQFLADRLCTRKREFRQNIATHLAHIPHPGGK